MALTKFSGAADVISQLDNQPNDNDGLSATQLKAKFDQYGATFKNYFNNTFIPEVEAEISAAAAGIAPTGISGTSIMDGTIGNAKLSSASGAQAVNTNVVRNGAITKEKLSIDVQNILDAVAGKATATAISVTLAANGWSDHQQTVTATGVKSNNIVLAMAGVDDTSHEAWSNCDLRAISQSTNSLTFKCRSTPSSAVNVNILILD